MATSASLLRSRAMLTRSHDSGLIGHGCNNVPCIDLKPPVDLPDDDGRAGSFWPRPSSSEISYDDPSTPMVYEGFSASRTVAIQPDQAKDMLASLIKRVVPPTKPNNYDDPILDEYGLSPLSSVSSSVASSPRTSRWLPDRRALALSGSNISDLSSGDGWCSDLDDGNFDALEGASVLSFDFQKQEETLLQPIVKRTRHMSIGTPSFVPLGSLTPVSEVSEPSSP